MFRYVHHVHYVVKDRDAMVAYLEETFGMKPDRLIQDTETGLKEALYDVGQTQVQISEPSDLKSNMGQYLLTHGPGVFHVAWAVENLRLLAQDLIAKGNKVIGRQGIISSSPRTTSSSGSYITVNVDPSSAHGVWFQLAERMHE